MTVAQDHLATIRRSAGRVLRRHGFRSGSARMWLRGDDAQGWVLVAWQGDKWNTTSRAAASLSAAVWPAGTREHRGELRGGEIEPFVAADAPVLGTARSVGDDPTADSYTAEADMPRDELAEQVRRAETFTEELSGWAETMLDPRISAASMADDDTVAALLVSHPEWPALDATLDRLTAGFQRDPRPIELHRVITRWRRGRNLAEVPLPSWSRYALPPHGAATLDSPRAELLAGIGTAVEFRFADGSTRPPRPEDLPDAALIRRWREESRSTPLPAGVLDDLPEWLPYVHWLDSPAPPEAPARRRLWPWRKAT